MCGQYWHVNLILKFYEKKCKGSANLSKKKKWTSNPIILINLIKSSKTCTSDSNNSCIFFPQILRISDSMDKEITFLNNSTIIEISIREDIYYKEPNLSIWVSWNWPALTRWIWTWAWHFLVLIGLFINNKGRQIILKDYWLIDWLIDWLIIMSSFVSSLDDGIALISRNIYYIY